MTEKTNQQARWWREWFNDIYLDVYSHRDDEAAVEEVRTSLQVVHVKPEDQVLDLCCGNGRHCRGLRTLGYQNVLGIDYSFPLLKHAMPECPKACYVRADMRNIPCQSKQFDALFSFFTSFGYFQTSRENRGVLDEIARVLRPGGWFLMDYLNPAFVRENFEPQSEKTHGDYHIKEIRYLTEDQKRIEKKIMIENWGGEEHSFLESVRLYEREEMLSMLSTAGLYVAGIMGDFTGNEFSLDSPRMILYGTRN